MSQNYNGQIEIIIADNSSTDGTSDICAEFAGMYPHLITHLLTDRSAPIVINGQATGRTNVIEAISKATGKYVALVEGDDYWLTNSKLKQQVEFLESHADYALTCSDVLVIDDNGTTADKPEMQKDEEKDVNALCGANFIYTASVMYRTEIAKQAIVHPAFRIIPAGDYFLHFFSAVRGKIHVFAERFAVYRVHSGGIWAGKSNSRQLLNLLLTMSHLYRLLSDMKEAEQRLVQTAVFHLESLFSQKDFETELRQFNTYQPELCSRISALKKKFENDFNAGNRRAMVAPFLYSASQLPKKRFFGRWFPFA